MSQEIEYTKEELIKFEEEFTNTTMSILEAAKGYLNVSEVSYNMFIDVLRTYLTVHSKLQDNPDSDYTNNDVKIKVFEDIFNFNFEDEITKVLNSKMDNNGEAAGDQDINNADSELLKNIKNNIQDYLK